MTVELEIAILLACVVVQAFFSGSEIAIVGADRLALRSRAEAGERSAAYVLELLRQPERVVGTCLVGANTATVAGSTTILHLLSRFGMGQEIFVVLFYAPLTILFAELLPKSVFHANADLLAPIMARPIGALGTVTRPFVWGAETITRGLMRLFGVTDAQVHTVRREDIQLLLDTAESADIHAEEKEMVMRVFNFSETLVQDAMVPLIEVVAVPESATCEEAAAMMVESGYSRLPVYRERIDRIVGMVIHHDVLFADDSKARVGSRMRPVVIVPETKAVDELFLDLRRKRQRLAVAVDEYGGAVGLISTEDILEEIVGEIEDEYDANRPLVRRSGEHEWIASGRVERDNLQRTTGFVLPDGDYDTLAGFLLDQLGHVPGVGERLPWAGWTFVVTKANDRAILEVSLQRTAPVDA